MIQSGVFAHFISNENPFMKVTDGVMSLTDSYVKELAKRGFKKDDVEDAGLNLLGKKIKKAFPLGSGITLTSNEMKYVMKVIKSLENRWILLKGTTRKITSHRGEFLDFLRPIITVGLALMESVLKPLAKSVLFPLGLSAEMSAADTSIQKIIYGSETTVLIIWNEEVDDIMKIAKSLEESGLLIQGISETFKNEAKEQKERTLLSVLLGTLAASILANALTGRGVIRAGEGNIRASENF